MNCDITNKIMSFALAILALAAVVLALRTISLTRELRSFQMAVPYNNYLMTVRAMAADVNEYSKTHPDLQKLLNTPPPTNKPAAK
jgi:hypothetical protein